MGTHLAKRRAVVAAEAIGYLVGGRRDVAKSLTVGILGFSAHASDGENLPVLYNTLLELTKQDPQSYRFIRLRKAILGGSLSADVPAA